MSLGKNRQTAMPRPDEIPWWSPQRPFGMRLSPFDAAALLAGAGLTVYAVGRFPDLAIVTPFVLLHYFIFCNLLRAGGPVELAWMTTFLGNAALWFASGSLSWWPILATQGIVTVALVAIILRSKRYHGVACHWINPDGYKAGSREDGEFSRRVLRRWGVPERIIRLLSGRNYWEHAQDDEIDSAK